MPQMKRKQKSEIVSRVVARYINLLPRMAGQSERKIMLQVAEMENVSLAFVYKTIYQGEKWKDGEFDFSAFNNNDDHLTSEEMEKILQNKVE